MATPIPAFVSQYQPSSTDTLQVTGGTLQTLVSTRWYYLVSNRTSSSSGQSLLKAVKDLLDASLAGTAWTVTLSSSSYKVQISHDNGNSRTVTWGAALQAALGFSSSTSVVATATTVTASYLSPYWWSPGMPVSLTGPVPFDPSTQFGCPTSVGAAQRAPDMTAAYVSNGVQYDAEYLFNGVQPYYKIRPQSGFTNEDLETFWSNGPRKGRRMLMWRNRSNATGSNAPSEGSASPYNYVEYNPQPDLRANLPAQLTSPYSLINWDVRFLLWVTENGETPLSD